MVTDSSAVGVYLGIENVTKLFGGVRAVESVSFAAYPGECLGVVGGNGAGKTTLLNMISGIVPTTRGTIRLGDKIINGMRPEQVAALGIGRTFQLAEQFQDMLAWEFVSLGVISIIRSGMLRYGLWLRNARRRELAVRSSAIAVLLDNGIQAWNTRLGDFPYGQQKVIDLLRATLEVPHTLLLDEPTSGTGNEEREVVRRIILGRKGTASNKITVMIDHDVEFVSSVCDRLLVMDSGKMVTLGSPGEVLAKDEVKVLFSGKKFTL